jgi:hypothetical protein
MNKAYLFLITLIVVGIASAAQPIATVTSSSSFQLRGHAVNVDGVPSWPLAAGDDIAAGREPATIQLRDGSRVILQQGSHLRIDARETTVEFHLLSGSLRMGSVVSPKVMVFVQGNFVRPVAGSLVSAGMSTVAPRPTEARPEFSLPHPVSSR